VNLPIYAVIAPALTGLVALLWSRPSLGRRSLVVVSAVAQLMIALFLAARAYRHGPLVLAPGGWGADLGIVLVADLLASIMLSLATFTALASILSACAARPVAAEHPLQLPLLQFLVCGTNLAFVTGDLFNLFVAFEVMLIASYALLSLEADNRNVRHSWSYLAINLVGSAIFLLGCALAYNLFGTLNFAEIAARADVLSDDPRLLLLALVLLVVFAIKSGLFPLYYWLPNSYPILPGPVAAFYSGMLTKVGVYVLARTYGTIFPPDLPLVFDLLAWTAGLTMVFGVLGAVARDRVQHILSYHIISQIGFMVLAIGFATPVAFAAAILYIVHHIVVKSALFLVGGAVIHTGGTDQLDAGGGLWRAAPWLGLGFMFQALSLAGLPPLSGFWGKYLIVVVGLEDRHYWLVAMSVVASILTLVSMLKIWLACFWREAPAGSPAATGRFPAGTRRLTAVVVGMTAVSLVIGLGVQWFYSVATEAARQTLDRPAYIENVTGRSAPDAKTLLSP
jgi:multicomponent Na+:H+ antiporter subunit D